MGRLEWNRDTIAFMKDASEYHPEYYRHLWEEISSLLGTPARICDCGCGTGYLSLQMAKNCSEVCALDRNPQAVSFLENMLVSQSLPNVAAVCADAFSYRPEKKFDAMVFCYFAAPELVLEIAKTCCSGTVCIVTRNYGRHRFSADGETFERDTYSAVLEYFARRGIPVRSGTCELEFGQPFRSLEDAERFFSIYSGREVKVPEITDRLEPAGAGEYRYYHPSLKKMGIVTFNIGDIK